MALIGTCSVKLSSSIPKTSINSVENKPHCIISASLRCQNTPNHKNGMSSFSKTRITRSTKRAVCTKEDTLQITEDCPSTLRDGISFSDDHNQVLVERTEGVETLKKHVRSMVVDERCTPEEKMVLIDAVERLGVGYHFKHEIEQQIEKIYNYLTQNGKEYDDLFTTALHFRLFRQHGYDVQPSVFGKFKDDIGAFKKALVVEIKGLMSLYEATYVECQGEHVLKEARAFASHCLRSAIPSLDLGLKEHVTRSLIYPVHCSIRAVEARYYISFYEQQESKNERLLKLAKLDFNIRQRSYAKDTMELTKWWDQFNMPSKFPSVRNIPALLYFCAVALDVDPQNSIGRICVAKIGQVMTLVNDIHGSVDATTYDELERFHHALERWDVKQKDQLPDYLQDAYDIIFNTFEELDQELSKYGRSHLLPYAREEFIKVIYSYLKKTKWYSGLETPTFEDIVSTAVDSSGNNALITAVLLGSQSVSEEALQYIASVSKIYLAAGLCVRYSNDISSYDREHKDTECSPTTPIEFYMKEHNVSKQESIEKFWELYDETWMTMNREWISTKDEPREVMELALNISRIVFYFYRNGLDEFSNLGATMGNDIEAMFNHPIPIHSTRP